jgi:hypothetical protein
MIETFTAEVLVTDHRQNYEPELARLASGWFESPVTCIALDVSLSAETGRLLAKGTYVPKPLPSKSRAGAAARWLGLAHGPGQAPNRL